MSAAYRISTDPAQLDLALIHRFLSQESYWARNVPLEIVQRAIANSLCFGMYQDERQVGFARVITDKATFGYLADVFIVSVHRRQGLGRRLIEAVLAHPELQGLRRLMLVTRDAHALYRQLGFTAPRQPEMLMEKRDPEVYRRASRD